MTKYAQGTVVKRKASQTTEKNERNKIERKKRIKKNRKRKREVRRYVNVTRVRKIIEDGRDEFGV